MDAWVGIAAILIGLASCFYGYPVFRIFLILAGLIYGYMLGQSFAPASHPWLSLVIGVGAAVVLAMLAYPLWSFGVIVIGAALGCMILGSLGIASHASQVGVILLGVLGAVVAGFLFYRAKDLFVMLTTAFNGAVQVVFGLDLVFPALAFRGRAGQLTGRRSHGSAGRLRFCGPVWDVQRSANVFKLDSE